MQESIKMDKQLYKYLQEHEDGSVATVCQMILALPQNQVDRLAYAFGPNLILGFEKTLDNYKQAHTPDVSFDVLYDITEKAIDKLYEGKERPQRTPQTVEQLLDTPMNEDVKNIKSSLKLSPRDIK